MLVCPASVTKNEWGRLYACSRESRIGGLGISTSHSEAGLPAVKRRAACTDSPCSPQVSPQLYSLLSPSGMPPKSDGETAIWKRIWRKEVDSQEEICSSIQQTQQNRRRNEVGAEIQWKSTKRVKEINVIWMWCIFNEAPVMQGLESRRIWRAVMGGAETRQSGRYWSEGCWR